MDWNMAARSVSPEDMNRERVNHFNRRIDDFRASNNRAQLHLRNALDELINGLDKDIKEDDSREGSEVHEREEKKDDDIQAEPTTSQIISSFRARLQTEAETLVREVFPQKVLNLDKMIVDEKYSFSRLPEILPAGDLNIPVPVQSGGRDAPAAKKRKIGTGEEECAVMANNGIIPKNEYLGELMEEIRPIIRDAVEDMNKIKMWITLLIPRIEDGNNFGVSIQEEALNEVRSTEKGANSFLNQLSRYFVRRAKLLTKVAKYPHVADYRRAILDMDEKQFVNIRLIITELRNHFATLHDMITKNMEKIKKPRSSNHDSMY